MKYLLSLFILVGVIHSHSWGSPAPAVCNFGDPMFETLSHQKVHFELPKQFLVGEDNLVIIHLEKPNLPSGYIVSVITDNIKTPKKRPTLQGWYPKTIIKPLDRGIHEISLQVNLIYKGS
jgi:hypothetical protein